ncbi:MAG TPA: alpha/beta hydrolase [Solirubrobacteraceae bacterium]|jgi:pimeloyl-ACP methyl ester carboxylesterase|nr:alpha/beta hydrolase [Solirubrobacteraceae bacterium]
MLRERPGPPRVLEGGEGDVLVSLHGGGGLHHDPALELLAEQFHVIAPELPGFAAGAPAPASFDELAEAVAVLLDEADVDTCTLAGTSFGAVVALHLALAAPERIAALVLLSPAVFAAGAGPPPQDIERALFAREGGPRPPRDPDELVRQRHAMVASLLDSIDEGDLLERLPSLELATLVVCGTQDGLFGSQHGHVFRELLPNCSSVLLYGAAHELGWDRPEALAALIGDFARRREAFVVTSR